LRKIVVKDDLLPDVCIMLSAKTHLSFKRLKGYFEPGGNNGGGVSKLGAADDGMGPFDLEEFPAFPDFTIPFFGGIPGIS
jgi:hypothetical protein